MPEDYYRRHSRDYFARTVTADAAAILQPLVAQVPPPARVLDLGCGGGRDLAWLKARGYTVFGIEAAPELARLARRHCRRPILAADFTTYPLERFRADLIIAVGSLVHLPHHQLSTCLKKIMSGLKRQPGGGHLYLSIKAGEGWKRGEDGRIFYLWQEDALERVFTDLGLGIVQAAVQPSALDDDAEAIWLGYLLRAGYHPR
jgi:SAM-dependent methyltransferase